MTYKRFPLPLATRQILHESCYFEHLHKSLRFLLAAPEDLDQIRHYLTTIHGKFDLDQLIHGIQQKWLILATDFFEICGVLIGKLVKENGVDAVQLEWIGAYPVYEKDQLIERQLLVEAFKYAFQQQINQILYSPQNEQSAKVAEKLGMTRIQSLNPFGENKTLQIEISKLGTLLTDEPRMPDAYLLDPTYSRRCLKTIVPKRLGRELKIEVAVVEDEPVFRHFMFNEFMQQSPVNKRLQLNEAESLEIYNTRLDISQFQQGLCLMVTDRGRICAAGTSKQMHVTAEERRRFQPIEVPMDLKEVIDKLPFTTQRTREVAAISYWMSAFVCQFLPPDCSDYIRVDMRVVHPYYGRCGIASVITECTDQIIREQGYKVCQALYLANAMSRKVEGRQPYPPVAVRFPYSQFKYNGRPIVPGGVSADGGDCVTVNVGPVRQPVQEERLAAKI